jgi:hypothetical protein
MMVSLNRKEVEPMGRFIDKRSSMNAGAPIAVPLTTPVLIGDIGLQTQGVAGNGGFAGGLIVDVNGTIGLQNITSVTASALVEVLRGAATIFTALITLGPVQSDVAPYFAQDLNAPAALQTQYRSFVSLASGAVTRVGPETFWGIASEG